MSKPALELGQRVTFTHGLHRLTEDLMRKTWLPHPNKEVATTPQEGIIIGRRTLANGENRYLGYDEPILFAPKERFTAYLIAYDLSRKPIYVRPEHIEAIA